VGSLQTANLPGDQNTRKRHLFYYILLFYNIFRRLRHLLISSTAASSTPLPRSSLLILTREDVVAWRSLRPPPHLPRLGGGIRCAPPLLKERPDGKYNPSKNVSNGKKNMLIVDKCISKVTCTFKRLPRANGNERVKRF
jgi:hypothetical protein